MTRMANHTAAVRASRRIVRLCLALLCLGAAATAMAAAPAVSLIPQPAELQLRDGELVLDAQTPIVVEGGDAASQATARYLADLLRRTRGVALPVRDAPPDRARTTILLRRSTRAPVERAEGYSLAVTAKGVAIEARDDAGLFYGAVTLSQLLTPGDDKAPLRLRQLQIRDWPRFGWRGLMLDSVRHMQSIEQIEQLIDRMARHKLNRFHWHLTDDQGWRLEIKRFPELTRVGAWRESPRAAGLPAAPRYGGYYTHDEARRIVAYAAARHITVIPEFDMPGHAQAVVASYPQYGAADHRPQVSPDAGIHPYLFNVDEPTFRFIEGVLDEIMAVFPSKLLHMGGDEAVKEQWKASKTAQAKIRELGLKDEEALQSWFMGRVGRYLADHDRRLIGWDEILDGGDLPENAIVMSWRGSEGAIVAARKGHDVILSSSKALYLDYVQTARADEITGPNAQMTTLSGVYAFDAVPSELDAAQAARVMGVQANVWTEYLPSPQHLDRAIYPRVAALAEGAWSQTARRDWRDFLGRLPTQLARYGKEGIEFSDTAFAVDIDVDANAALDRNRAQVTLKNQVGSAAIHYTVDGSEPDRNSPRYRGEPLSLPLPARVRAVALDRDGAPLGRSRERMLDRATLLSRDSAELPPCPGGPREDFLRVQPYPDATSLLPAYNLSRVNSCRYYPNARLNGVDRIRIDAVRLPRNYVKARDPKQVMPRPGRTARGEWEVRKGDCNNGPVLAQVPLPDPAVTPASFSLEVALPTPAPAAAPAATENLCLIFTAPITGPLYAIGRASLIEADTAAP